MSQASKLVQLSPRRTRGGLNGAELFPKLRVLLIGLYTERYPAIGETHGLSVIGASLQQAFHESLEEMRIVDLVAFGSEDLVPVIAQTEAFRPNVVGVSVPYGTYSTLLQLAPILRSLLDGGACVMLGGALPTYLSDRMLVDVDPRVVVVIGEGEEASVGAVLAWAGRFEWSSVPNLHMVVNGTSITTARSLVDVTKVPAPYRAHLPGIIASGAQVFAESSRACSWAACSFCLRGLTDIDGKPREFRRFGKRRLVDDLKRLSDLGVTAVTFADEDFLGGQPDEIEKFADVLEHAIQAVAPRRLAFDASVTVRSIYQSDDTKPERLRRHAVLRRLVSMGLRKIFLGIESGSASQLRRYAKGHTPDECAAASREVLAAGAKLELGFIMFDPLCSRSEIIENVRFLLDNTLAQYASSPTAELRIQIGSQYLRILHKAEGQLGIELYDRELDLNTLSYHYRFADADVAELAQAVRRDNARRQALVYRLKGLTRFGDGKILGVSTNEVGALLGQYRTRTLEALAQAALAPNVSYEVEAKAALRDLAVGVVGVNGLGNHSAPLVKQAVEIARALTGAADLSML
jgi:radical SAM superfamily enzyme YgiQ (UPF0313 family)